MRDDADDAEAEAKVTSEKRCWKGAKEELSDREGSPALSEVMGRRLLSREYEEAMGAAAAGCVREAVEARERTVTVAAGDAAGWRETHDGEEVVWRAVKVIEGRLSGGDGERAGGMAEAMDGLAVVDWFKRGVLYWVTSGDGVRVVVGAGGDVAAVDTDGWTPLHVAAHWDREGAVCGLVGAGADVNAVDKGGSTPLHGAAMAGREGVVCVLVGSGADVNAADADGMTPPHWAAQEGREGIVGVLVGAGADVNAVGRAGETPLYLASRNGRGGVVGALRAAGADQMWGGVVCKVGE